MTSPSDLNLFLRKLPKAELHLHLEGMLSPQRVLSFAKKYCVTLDSDELASRYNLRGFTQFLELYKWATSFLREPEDYAHLAQDAVTGPQVQYIFDAIRQFGPTPAMEVARAAVELKHEGVVAFGLGGDELSLPLSNFRLIYKFAAEHGLHLVAHAGETGGPEQIQDAIDLLGAQRIGHGIAAIRSAALMNTLANRKIPLEICPTSNLRTNALSIQLSSAHSRLAHHPLPRFFRHGIPVTISTDDPAMFNTTLLEEYSAALQMGLSLDDLLAINRTAFEHSFLSDSTRQSFLTHLPSSPAN